MADSPCLFTDSQVRHVEELMRESGCAQRVMDLESLFEGLQTVVNWAFRCDNDVHCETCKDADDSRLKEWHIGFEKLLVVCTEFLDTLERKAKQFAAHQYENPKITPEAIAKVRKMIAIGIEAIGEMRTWKPPEEV